MASCDYLYSALFALFWIGGRAQYTACNGTTSWIADGYCNSINNNIECGYDGGDCCECTCSQDRLYPCGFVSFDCLDPSASNITSECQNTTNSSALCSTEYTVQDWVVNDTTSATSFAEAVNCTDGTFNVTWKGRVVIDRTIYVAEGTVVHLTGSDSESEVDGGGSIRIFTLVNASLHLFGMVLSNGNATYGGAIAAAGSKITLNDATFHNNIASSVAGAVYMENSIFIAWGGQATFAKNSAGLRGGALVVERNSDIYWSGPTSFFNNTAPYYAGALYIHKSTISWSGETFFVNNSGGAGGSLYIGDNSSVSWSAETSFISNNAAAGSGGALYVDDGCRVWWNGTSSFIDNAANWSGGALFINENSDVSWSAETSFNNNAANLSGGALYIYDDSSVSWFAQTSFLNNRGDFGGAIYVRAGSNMSWTAATSFNVNNAVTGSGGALYIDDGCNVWWGGNTSFSNNAANWSGGALYIEEGCNVWWGGNTSFSKNAANWSGGALYIEDGCNVWWGGNTSFNNNAANLRGGALCIYDDSSVSWFAQTSFLNNRGDFGGAIYVRAGSNMSWTAATSFNINNAVTGSGGALYIDDGCNVWWGGNTSFSNNAANWSGGALYIEDGCNVWWGGNTSFSNNAANLSGGALYIYNDSSVSWFAQTSFLNNRGDFGGAIYVRAGSNMSWTAATSFNINNAVTGSGGALYIDDGCNVWWGGNTSFSNNAANWSGGALYIEDGCNVWWGGITSFSNNAANLSGGALYIYDDSSVSWFAQTSFLNNRGDFGGAIYVRAGSNMSWTAATSFNINNAVTGSGGALYIDDGCNVWWGGNTSFSNNAANWSGGALYIEDGCNVWWGGNTSFSNNAANWSGGALFIYNDSSVSWFAQTSFHINTAENYGGALCIISGSNTLWEAPTSFFNNSASSYWGGAVFLYYNSDLFWGATTSFISNTAGALGGALCSLIGSTITMAGDTFFVDNFAGTDGGAAYIYHAYDQEQSFVTIYNTTVFRRNRCEAYGGGMALIGSVSTKLEAVNMTFYGNIAGVAGGAVYVSGAILGPKFVGTRFVSNSAEMGGGVYTTGSGIDVEPNMLGGSEPLHPFTFISCEFKENKAATRGGALDSGAGFDRIINTLFVGNTARSGGALRLTGEASLEGCEFVENSSDEDKGAAVYNEGLISNLSNCRFVKNTFNCESNHFLAFNESHVSLDTVCKDCVAECESCNFEGKEPMCVEEMDHSSSPGGNTTVELLSIEHGYWRVSNTSTNILDCYKAKACKGGVTGATEYCLKGYEGPYCSVCSDGYTPSLGSTCNKCPDTSGLGITLIVVFGVVAFVACVAILNYMLSGKEPSADRGIVARISRFIPLHSLKIIVVVWQILTQFCTVANFSFPSIYQEFLDGIDLLSFDFSWVISTGCILDIDFHDRLLISTLGPIIGMAILGATYTIAINRHRGSEAVSHIVRRKHLSMVLLLTFLVYSSVSTTVFTMFVCDDLDDGTTYLRVDYRINCDSSEHKALQIYAGFMVVFYAVGIPAFYAFLLFSNRDTLTKDENRENNDSVTSFADLWNPYKPRFFFYEVVECCRRVLLTGMVVFIYPDTAAQIAIAVILATAFLIVSEALAPYESAWDCLVSRMGHAIVVTSLFLALLLKVDVSEEDAKSQKVFEAVLITLHATMILVVNVEAGAMIIAWKKEVVSADPVPRSGRRVGVESFTEEIQYYTR